jgi:hypothetical protein
MYFALPNWQIFSSELNMSHSRDKSACGHRRFNGYRRDRLCRPDDLDRTQFAPAEEDPIGIIYSISSVKIRLLIEWLNVFSFSPGNEEMFDLSQRAVRSKQAQLEPDRSEPGDESNRIEGRLVSRTRRLKT